MPDLPIDKAIAPTDTDSIEENVLLLLIAIDRGCQIVDQSEDWSAKLTDILVNIRDRAEALYIQLSDAQATINTVSNLAQRFQRERDQLLRIIRENDSLLNRIPDDQADLITWLAMTLAVPTDKDSDYVLKQALAAIRRARKQAG